MLSGLFSCAKLNLAMKQTALLVIVLVAALCLLQAPGRVHCKRYSVAIDTTGKSAASASDFVPTEEWRVVAPGQRIPPGLHVRMNIQTGHTEARLMPPEGSSDDNNEQGGSSNLPALVANSNNEASSAEEAAANESENVVGGLSSAKLREALNSRRMKEALKKIKAENLASESANADGEASSSRTGQFRSYEDLKADFAKINAGIKTDLEVIKELLAEWHQSAADAANRLRILNELEYHLRQIDNAQNFVQLGGLDLLMSQANASFANGTAASSTGEGHQRQQTAATAALRVLAASCQGNAPVQVEAVKSGFLPLLLRLMMADSGADRLTRSASVLALASLCRNFPHAQTVLLKSGGLAALRSAFESRDADRPRLIRIATLLADLALEAVEADAEFTTSSHNVPATIERRRQYQQVAAAKSIAESGWCSPLLRLLNFTDHDSVEKVITAMSILFDVCGAEFASQPGTMDIIDRLGNQYASLAKEELLEEGASGGYFDQMRQRIDVLKLKFKLGQAESKRTEL